jgi:hypothetical protein
VSTFWNFTFPLPLERELAWASKPDRLHQLKEYGNSNPARGFDCQATPLNQPFIANEEKPGTGMAFKTAVKSESA